MVWSAGVPNCAGHPIAGCNCENPEKLGLLGSFCGCRLQIASPEKAGAEAVLSGPRAFFSWPSEDSRGKLMLVFFTPELEEPAECSLSTKSPLLT